MTRKWLDHCIQLSGGATVLATGRGGSEQDRWFPKVNVSGRQVLSIDVSGLIAGVEMDHALLRGSAISLGFVLISREQVQ